LPRISKGHSMFQDEIQGPKVEVQDTLRS
jgi:hypothetical protein